MNKKHKKIKISPQRQLVLALLLFTFTVVLSRPAPMVGWEIDVFKLIYGLPGFLHPVFFVITQFGTIYAAGLAVAFYLYKKRYHVALKILLSSLLAFMSAGFAKDIWGRERPTELLVNVVNLDYTVRGPGFPSGHVALATVLALTLFHYLPKKYRWTVPVVIIGVGISRMYLGVHAPLDIIGGFALGWVSYALFRLVRIYSPAVRQNTN